MVYGIYNELVTGGPHIVKSIINQQTSQGLINQQTFLPFFVNQHWHHWVSHCKEDWPTRSFHGDLVNLPSQRAPRSPEICFNLQKGRDQFRNHMYKGGFLCWFTFTFTKIHLYTCDF